MRWYDPISERWIETKEKPPEKVSPVVEDDYKRAERLLRERRIWDAVVDVSSGV